MKKHLRWLGAIAALAVLGACGGSGGRGSNQGFVASLTGDPDDEVSPALQELVERAYAIPCDGQPIDD